MFTPSLGTGTVAPPLLERHKIEDVITKSSDSDESKTATFQLHSNLQIPIVTALSTAQRCVFDQILSGDFSRIGLRSMAYSVLSQFLHLEDQVL